MNPSMIAGIAGWVLAGLLIAIGEGRRRDEAKAHMQGVALGRAYERAEAKRKGV